MAASIASVKLGRPGVRCTFRDDEPEMVIPLSSGEVLFAHSCVSRTSL